MTTQVTLHGIENLGFVVHSQKNRFRHENSSKERTRIWTDRTDFHGFGMERGCSGLGGSMRMTIQKNSLIHVLIRSIRPIRVLFLLVQVCRCVAAEALG